MSFKNKEIAKEYYKRYHATHKEGRNAYSKEWRTGHIEKLKEYKKEYKKKWDEENPGLAFKDWIKRAYNLSMEEYKGLLNAQQNKCAICETEFSTTGPARGSVRKACVDHNHETGKVRALLCGRCNKSIGQFEDSVEILQKAMNYLLKHSS